MGQLSEIQDMTIQIGRGFWGAEIATGPPRLVLTAVTSISLTSIGYLPYLPHVSISKVGDLILVN